MSYYSIEVVKTLPMPLHQKQSPPPEKKPKKKPIENAFAKFRDFQFPRASIKTSMFNVKKKE